MFVTSRYSLIVVQRAASPCTFCLAPKIAASDPHIVPERRGQGTLRDGAPGRIADLYRSLRK